MPDRTSVAFFSYVHADDEHDGGAITRLHAALESEARIQIGRTFPIFIDRDDIAWGENWRQRVDDSLDAVSLLIPVITPSFFQSGECRRELERFLERERKLDRADLIWPIYYVSAAEMEDPGDDDLGRALAARQHTDWRRLRFEPLTSSIVRQRLAALAERLRDTLGGPAPRHTAATTSEPTSEKPSVTPTDPPTLVVDPYGRGHHMTIGDAIDAAQPGDRILVRPGLYEEGLVLDKPLELIGQGAAEDIIVTAKDIDAVIFQTNIGRVSNLTLRQTGGDGVEAEEEVDEEPLWHGVDITQGRLELEGCDISSTAGSCVAVRTGADPRVRGNRIHGGSEAGVFVYGQALGTFEDNEIIDNANAGFEVQDGSNPTVRRNRIEGNAEAGVLVHERSFGSFEGNEILGNAEAGVEIRGGSRVTLRQNGINRNGHEGISVHENSGGTFEGNDLRDNAAGPWDIDEDSEANVVRRDNLEE